MVLGKEGSNGGARQMKSKDFETRFMKAAQEVREKITQSGTVARTDVTAMESVQAAGLPATDRENLPVWVLLVATLPLEAIDYQAIIQMSYRLTIPWWRRVWYQMADAYRNLEDYDDSEVTLRSWD